ncbi:MAG: hypothetical protein IKA64_00555 [Clostridia bacterium]|nr:hypothetical protein [Clostridia bacterium]
MTVLNYTVSDGYGEISSFVGGGGRAVFKIDGAAGGVLHVGRLCAPIIDGRCEINLSKLPDGDYTPIISVKSRGIELEGIRKFGRELLPLPTSEKTLRRLISRVAKLEDRLGRAEAEIAALSEKIARGLTF